MTLDHDDDNDEDCSNYFLSSSQSINFRTVCLRRQTKERKRERKKERKKRRKQKDNGWLEKNIVLKHAKRKERKKEEEKKELKKRERKRERVREK